MKYIGNFMVVDKESRVICIEPQKGQSIEDYIENDFHLEIDKPPETLSCRDHKLVIVGVDISGDDTFGAAARLEEKAVYRQIKRLKFDVERETELPTIRNSFLSFGNFLVFERGTSVSGINDRLTRAPLYVFGNDFVMASDSLIKNYNEKGVSPRKVTNETTVRKFWRAFGIEKVYFIPPAEKVPKKIISEAWAFECIRDLDYTMNSIPWLDIYTVDRDHYEEQKEVFQEIERQEGIQFTIISPTKILRPILKFKGEESLQEVDLWSNTYLALPEREVHSWGRRDETVVLYNSLAPIAERVGLDYNQRLHKQRIWSFSSPIINMHKTDVPIIASSFFGKTLHCMTHTSPDRNTYEEFKKLV
jgi:hypothetical protein